MEAVKQLFGTIAAVVGVLSGLVTLYAKYADMKKKKAGREDDFAESPPVPTPVHHSNRPIDFDEPPVVLTVQEPPPVSSANARQMVKAPAIALMLAGGLSFFLNLATAGFGYVDEFVTPLTTETKARRAAEAVRLADPKGATPYAAPVGDSDRTSTIMGVIALFSCSFASAAAAWAGYNMLRLRSYWLSVAGSVAVMPGACLYCFAGLPIGIWSLTVLLKPEVSSSFR